MAAELGAAVGNQFDNIANRQAHYETTGPEIWRDTRRPDRCVRQRDRHRRHARRRVALPQGEEAGSAHRARRSAGQRALQLGKARRAEVVGSSAVTEGIGIGRITANLADSPIDDAVQIEDPEIVRTTYRLLREEGLFLGSTSGTNVAAAVRVARDLGPGHTIVTILCDGGHKYVSRFYNREWLETRGLLQYCG